MNQITFSDFEKIQIHVGTITEVDDFEKAKKPAFKLLIDFGPLGIKKSSAQITKRYTKESLIGKQVLAVLNFPPKQIANFVSECLVLGLYENSMDDVVLIEPQQSVTNGARLR
jgi:tRNA-binding protein